MEIIDEIVKRVRDLNPDKQKKLLKILRRLQECQKRDYQRLNKRIEVDAAVGNRVLQTETKDIGAGGMYITTSGEFEIGKPVGLVFTILGPNPTFKLKGTIVRVEPDGIAIKFEKMSPISKKYLNDLLWESADM